MTQNEIITIIISSLSFLIACGSLGVTWYSYHRTNTKHLYQLRSELIIAAKTVDSEWDNLLNDIYHAKQRIQKKLPDPVAQEIYEYYCLSEKAIFRKSSDDMKELYSSIRDNIDVMTEKRIYEILRIMETSKVTLAEGRKGMEKKLILLESSVACD